MNQAPEEQEILNAIDKIKAHRIFNRSPLMCAFLSYVTVETIQGRESRISAYSVAVDALGKPTDFDPQMDPSVRVLAKRLRDSLACYYDDATDYTLCVVLKPGSYVPSFHRAEPESKQTTSKDRESDVERATGRLASDTSKLAWTPPVVFYSTEDSDPVEVDDSKKNNHVA